MRAIALELRKIKFCPLSRLQYTPYIPRNPEKTDLSGMFDLENCKVCQMRCQAFQDEDLSQLDNCIALSKEELSNYSVFVILILCCNMQLENQGRSMKQAALQTGQTGLRRHHNPPPRHSFEVFSEELPKS